HIIPVAAGGENLITNLTTACGECNRGKGASLLAQLDDPPHYQLTYLRKVNDMKEISRLSMERWDHEKKAYDICTRMSEMVQAWVVEDLGVEADEEQIWEIRNFVAGMPIEMIESSLAKTVGMLHRGAISKATTFLFFCED